jgi:hypothetical protein
MAPPPSLADGIHVASGLDLSQALAAVLAGLVVDFNPFEPGSPFCPGQCDLPANLTTEGIVRSILALPPGNPVITEWLARVADGTANGPTQAQRDFLTQEWPPELGVFKFNPDTTTQINAVLNSINPVLPSIAAHSGLLGGFDGTALLADIAKLLGFGAMSSAIAPAAPSTAALLSGTGSQTGAPGDGQGVDAPSRRDAKLDSPTPTGMGDAAPLVASAGPADPPKTGAPVVALAVATPVAADNQPAQPPADVPGQSTPRQAADIVPAPTAPAGGDVFTPVQGTTPRTTTSTDTTNNPGSGTAPTNTSATTSTDTTNNPGSGTAPTNTSATTSTGPTKNKWRKPKKNPSNEGSTTSSSNGDTAGAASPANGGQNRTSDR